MRANGNARNGATLASWDDARRASSVTSLPYPPAHFVHESMRTFVMAKKGSIRFRYRGRHIAHSHSQKHTFGLQLQRPSEALALCSSTPRHRLRRRLNLVVGVGPNISLGIRLQLEPGWRTMARLQPSARHGGHPATPPCPMPRRRCGRRVRAHSLVVVVEPHRLECCKFTRVPPLGPELRTRRHRSAAARVRAGTLGGPLLRPPPTLQHLQIAAADVPAAPQTIAPARDPSPRPCLQHRERLVVLFGPM
jgi:hypothetical protein